MTRRFTVDGSDRLEQRIASDVSRIRDAALGAAAPDELTAVILGGGYGRGEGAVWREDGREAVYNDYDFFLVTPFTSRRRRRAILDRVQDATKRLEPEVGVHIDFGPPFPEAALPRLPYELMLMEMKAGHIVLHGPETILSAMPAYDTRRVPLEEGARLLTNRGVGLFLARRLLNRSVGESGGLAPLSPPLSIGNASVKPRDELLGNQTDLNETDRQFIIRNLYKALLAAGDSVLFIQESYSPSYLRRGEMFDALDPRDLPFADRLPALYRAALEFKLRPVHAVPAGMNLRDWLDESIAFFRDVFLWFERRRLRNPALTWNEYQHRWTRLSLPGPAEAGANALRNLRNGGWRLGGGAGLILPPRDHLLKTIPSLLAGTSDPAQEEAFLRVWRQYG